MGTTLRRQDRVEADLRCLMCGRLIGTAFGDVWREGERTPRSPTHLTLFRWAQPEAATVRFTGREQFRCVDCGGFGVMEEIQVSVAAEVIPVEDGTCLVHSERMRGAGRRPRGCSCLRSFRKAA
jgi:hypothetical protein